MATAVIAAPPQPAARKFVKLLRDGDKAAHLITLIFAASVFLVTVFLVYELWVQSSPARAKFGFEFLFSKSWDPVAEKFGALPFIYGTVLTSLLALLISVPLAVGAAIFLSELAPPKLSNTCTFLVELLAAVPSVIYGLLAFFTLVPLMRIYIEPFLKKNLGFLPFFQGPAYGYGYLTAAMILSIMTFPFIISISRESLLAVPREQREAALALGATKWESTWQVVVPHARLGIIGSIFLALARALGETMAVTMVIGNDPAVHASLIAPGYTIAAIIANEFTEATGELYQGALVELGLVLFLITIILNAAAQLLIVATTKKGSKHD
ncbi:MAG TPA: phosphate ABC transporter permease subunit PstC [Bryobacteraceae bacterium]|jgi:phosphate transport system permease protein|nr:phosphate ABC transporter permease subunit PstC [Bryobacteraceae bacterium]